MYPPLPLGELVQNVWHFLLTPLIHINLFCSCGGLVHQRGDHFQQGNKMNIAEQALSTLNSAEGRHLIESTKRKHQGKRFWTTEDIRQIGLLVGEIPVTEIAEKFHTTAASIYSLMHIHGLKSNQSKLRTRYDYDLIRKLIMQGKTAKEVGQEIGCDGRHIRWLAANKLSAGVAEQLRRNGRKAMRTKNNPRYE